MIVHKGASMADKYSRYLDLYWKNADKYGQMENPAKSFEDFSKAYTKTESLTHEKRWSAETVIKKIVSKDTTRISHEQALAGKASGYSYQEVRYGRKLWDTINDTYYDLTNPSDGATAMTSTEAKHFIATTFFGSP